MLFRKHLGHALCDPLLVATKASILFWFGEARRKNVWQLLLISFFRQRAKPVLAYTEKAFMQPDAGGKTGHQHRLDLSSLRPVRAAHFFGSLDDVDL